MIEWIKDQPQDREILFVLLAAFGWPVAGSLLSLGSQGHAVTFSDSSLIYTAAIEVLILALVGSVLRVRGWKMADLQLQFSPVHIPLGFGLALGAFVAYVITYLALQSFVTGTIVIDSTGVTLLGILVIVAVNPLYEEVFVVGYIFAASERLGRGATHAINFSIGLRLLYHLYQGPVGIIGIIPAGLIFAFVFARWRRLWPLVVAHAIQDLMGFLTMP